MLSSGSPKNLSIQEQFLAHAHNIQLLTLWHLSRYRIVFQTQPRNPLNVQLNDHGLYFFNEPQNTAPIYHLIQIISPLILIRCFIASS